MHGAYFVPGNSHIMPLGQSCVGCCCATTWPFAPSHSTPVSSLVATGSPITFVTELGDGAPGCGAFSAPYPFDVSMSGNSQIAPTNAARINITLGSQMAGERYTKF